MLWRPPQDPCTRPRSWQLSGRWQRVKLGPLKPAAACVDSPGRKNAIAVSGISIGPNVTPRLQRDVHDFYSPRSFSSPGGNACTELHGTLPATTQVEKCIHLSRWIVQLLTADPMDTSPTTRVVDLPSHGLPQGSESAKRALPLDELASKKRTMYKIVYCGTHQTQRACRRARRR